MSRWNRKLLVRVCLLFVSLMLVSLPGKVKPVVASQVFKTSGASCGQKNQTITTGKGSKQVRTELNRLYLETICAKSRLDDVYQKSLRRHNSELARFEKNKALNGAANKKKFVSCSKRFKLKEGDLLGAKIFADSTRFKVPYGPKFPCYQEYESYLATESRPEMARPWLELKAWITSWQNLYVLADRYPDSVKPSFLPHIIRGGKNALSCDPTRVWCYQS